MDEMDELMGDLNQHEAEKMAENVRAKEVSKKPVAENTKAGVRLYKKTSKKGVPYLSLEYYDRFERKYLPLFFTK